jgi:hypothetical protein
MTSFSDLRFVPSLCLAVACVVLVPGIACAVPGAGTLVRKAVEKGVAKYGPRAA